MHKIFEKQLLHYLFLAIILSLLSRNTFFIPFWLAHSVSALIALLAGYVLYSIVRYFGVERPAGIDHFDVSYRNKPLVREGIFKYVKNPMYVFGLGAFWLPGLLLGSFPGLLAALFMHIYIWVHYFFTEKPDMEYIYGKG